MAKKTDCAKNELFFQAIRMDESRHFDTPKGRELLEKYGKIYSVWVWSPDVGVHIASATRSAELWLVDYVTELLGDTDEAYEEWFDIKSDLLRESEPVDYMDYGTVKHFAENKGNVCNIGCFEFDESERNEVVAQEAIEYYQGNPCW